MNINMTGFKAPTGEEAPSVLSCELCCSEVPVDKVHTSEVDEIVMHFCGLECYQAWASKRKAVNE